MAEERPFPLLILSAYYTLIGFFMILGAIIAPLLKIRHLNPYFIAVIGIVFVFIGYGLYMRERIAWFIAVGVEFISMLNELIHFSLITLLGALWHLAIILVLLYYCKYYNVNLPFPTPAPTSIHSTSNFKFYRPK